MARKTTSGVTDDLADNLGRLVRHEMRTIGDELRRKAGQAGLGAGLVAFGLVMALYAGGCVVAGIVALLARVMPAWLAAAVVAAVLATVAGLAAALGVGEVRRATPLVPEEAAADIAAAADNAAPDDQRG
ncbi:MAG TPA: phage holin family protein [Pseudonocardiaceae bacterium]|nr:phage holin family protein [Pseudonocardiaceae bacterium]